MDKRRSFGIIAIATTMLGAMLLSSCNHDEFYYSEEKAESLANEKYAAAFEKAFGKVGPNVDWGFSSKKAGTRAFTRAGVAFPTTITFPSDCDASKFNPDLRNVLSYDDYCKSIALNQWNIPTEFGYGVVYIDNVQYIHINGGPNDQQRAKLYIKAGTYSFTSESFYLGKYVDLYLLEGATVTFDNSVASTAIFDIYIAEGAELIANGADGLVANSGAHIYNHGTITCSKFEANTTSVLYNSGVVNSTGTLSAESNSTDGVNNLSFIVNNGEIECADVVVNAGAVLNIFDWNVTGTTKINSPNSGWINNGQWTTYDYAYVAGSKNVINNCHLEVNHDFDMNVSSLSAVNETNIGFKINSGGSVETVNFYGGRNLANGKVEGGPFRIYMAEYSLFKVTNKATLESSRGPISDNEVGFGFFGPSEGGYAVFQAKDIIRDETLAAQKNHGAVTYGGNLYVSAETHFAQGYDSDGSGSYTPRPFIFEQGGFTLKNIYVTGDYSGEDFNTGKPSITIEESDCSPGFQGGDPLYRVIAEDLSADQAGDFDFNDVVFDVVKYDQSKNMTTLRLQACGGTLPLKIGSTKGEGGIEVHSLYGETAPDPTTGLYKMWNTSPSVNKHDPVDFEITGQYITPEQLLALRIEVLKNGEWMLLTATKGVAACKILVDDRFPIVPERHSIADKFGNFTTYVQGNWKENDDFWWIQK